MNSEDFELTLKEGISEDDIAMCHAYWSIKDNYFENSIETMLLEFNKPNESRLVEDINYLSCFSFKKTCMHESCNEKLTIVSRKELTTVIYQSRFKNFPRYKAQYVSFHTTLLSIFSNYDFFCDTHIQSEKNKIKAELSDEFNTFWPDIKLRLEFLYEFLHGVGLEILNLHLPSGKASDSVEGFRHYFNDACSGHTFKNKLQAWNFFCDYWSRTPSEWTYSEEELKVKYEFTNALFDIHLRNDDNSMPEIIRYSGTNDEHVVIKRRTDLERYLEHSNIDYVGEQGLDSLIEKIMNHENNFLTENRKSDFKSDRDFLKEWRKYDTDFSEIEQMFMGSKVINIDILISSAQDITEKLSLSDKLIIDNLIFAVQTLAYKATDIQEGKPKHH